MSRVHKLAVAARAVAFRRIKEAAAPASGPRPGEVAPPWLVVARTRPRYFDGRFLAARDLERDQLYFAARQAELLQAAGAGVVCGLEAERKDHATLTIAAGIALTPGGRAVVLEQALELPLADGAATQRLDRELGLSGAPGALARRRSGVFVLLARPVEYTANPIGFYPASLSERREPEDGEIVEAVAFTLMPLRDAAIDGEPRRQRSALARRIFVERAEAGVPVEAVPLAVVQLERGSLRWVDPWLVRREIGEAHDGAGAQRRTRRAVVEAHVQQYSRQLAELLAAREASARPLVASDAFAALPPVGPYPASSLDLPSRADRFFPPALRPNLCVVPGDELPAIVDEALTLPPIDLAAGDASLSATSLAVVIAIPRRHAEVLPAPLRRFALRPASAPRLPLPSVDLDPLTAVLNEPSLQGHIHFAYVRLRRAIGDTEDGVLPVQLQEIG